MKNRLKKVIGLILITSVIGSTMVGCQNANKQNQNNENSINIWANVSKEDFAYFKEVTDKWTEESGIEVNYIASNTDGKEYMEAFERPDIVWGMPATDTEKVQVTNSIDKVPGDLFKDDEYISKDLTDATAINGEKYGIPIYQDTVALFYNKDKVNSVPNTMEELVEEAKTVGFTAEIDNKIVNYGFINSYGGYYYKNNDGVFDDQDIGSDNEGAIKGYEFLQKIITEDKLLIAGTTDMMAEHDFSVGQDAYYIGQSGRVRTFTEKNVNFGVAKIPTLAGNEVKPLKLVSMAVVNSNSKKKDDAWKLLRYMQDNLSEYVMKTGPKAPVLKKSLETDTFKQTDYLKGLYEQSLEATLLPNTITGSAYELAIDNTISCLNLGQYTPEECGAKIKKDLIEARELLKVK